MNTMDVALKNLVEASLAKRVFNAEDLKGYKSTKEGSGICDCDDGDDSGGCSD